ncbi:GAF domain-containing sensor histidine kinase [Fimbriimonadia bacterium ATM]|nr:MAG: hypothetical protein EDM73_02530 [Armatimonadota bacterium]MBC6968626.1 hypothetical protein [Armatimonadota bacterium]MCE7898535.1 hypothetical protein [Armatimonadetes bacterium ATM1]MDL1928172.1 GAF domain-containing sensor histidine kinase [Fimbriimonadia bacterium ATM]RIJ98263.1 MAG: hypothetical protein DCC45_00395 [Armatimonadota bacterium]
MAEGRIPTPMSARDQRLVQAVHLATQKLSTAASLDETLREVLEICVTAAEAFGGTIYIHDKRKGVLEFRHVIPEEVKERLPGQQIPDDFGEAGMVFHARKAQITCITPDSGPSIRAPIESATQVTIKNILTAPLMVEGMDPIGVVQLVNKRSGDFDQSDLQVIETVCAVSAMAYMNSLLTEQAAKSASLLGMSKVAHDIANQAAVLKMTLNYVQPMIRELSPDAKAEDVESYRNAIDACITDLDDSVDRIISYGRLMSDLSAGKELRPKLKPGCMASAVANSAAFLETAARDARVAIRYDVAASSDLSMFDPVFIDRIVQNLVGNSIKAVVESLPEGWSAAVTEGGELPVAGEVAVKYRQQDGDHLIEVSDTGPGMSKEVVDRILEGTATSKWTASTGSGWGTKIVRELADALGGRIEIESEPGLGTTFRVRLTVVPCDDKVESAV